MPVFKFFHADEEDGEILFQEKLVKAITLIRENNSVIARDVLRVLESSTLTLNSFYTLSPQHFMEIMNDMNALNMGVSIDYPPSKKTVRDIEQYLGGIIFNNQTIYISSNNSIDDMAKTIIHEVSHFINNTILNKEVRSEGFARARYNDEMRSFIEERVFERNGSCVLRSDVKKIHDNVTKSYPEFSKELDEQPQGYLFSTYDAPRP